MVDLGGGPGLPGQPSPEGVVGAELVPQHLEGHRAAVAVVEGPEHDPHAALAQPRLDAVGPEPVADLESGRQ